MRQDLQTIKKAVPIIRADYKKLDAAQDKAISELRKRDKELRKGSFDADMNYYPPGFEDVVRTDQIGDTQGEFMPSNPEFRGAGNNKVISPETTSTRTSRTVKAAETLVRYLTNKLPEGKWNDYMGKDYVKYAFEKGFLNDKGGITVGDNVIGSASSLTFDRKSGRYRMNFKGLGVDDNFTQFSKGDYNLWSKSVLNALGKYSADLQPAGLPWWLSLIHI